MQVRCHAACRTTAEQDFFRVAKAVILLELAYQRIQVGFASKVQRRVGAVFPMCWTERNNTKQTKMIIIMLTPSYRKSYRKAPSAWIDGNTCLPTRENAVGDNCLPTRENTGCILSPLHQLQWEHRISGISSRFTLAPHYIQREHRVSALSSAAS